MDNRRIARFTFRLFLLNALILGLLSLADLSQATIIVDWTFDTAGGTNVPAGFPGGPTTATTAYPRAEGAKWTDATPVQDVSGFRHHGRYNGGANSGFVTYLTPSGTAGHKFNTTGNGLSMRRNVNDRNTGQKANFNYGTSNTPDLPYMAPGVSWTVEELVNFDAVGADTAVQSQRIFGHNENVAAPNVQYLVFAQNDAANSANTGIRVRFLTNAVGIIDAVFNTTAVNDSSWHHLAVVFNRTANAVSVYMDYAQLKNINGVAGSGLLDISTISPQNIGQGNATGGGIEIYVLNGALDRMAVTDAVLTPVAFVVPQKTSTMLGSSPNPSVVGSDIVFTATVQTNGVTAAAATGAMVFKDGGTPLSTNVVSSGVAAYTNNNLAAGWHTLTAEYGGDIPHGPNASSAMIQLVGSTGNPPTTTDLSSSPNPSVLGSDIVFTATVQTNGVTAGVATGTMVFREGLIALGTNVVTGGVSTYTNSTLSFGSHVIRAEYSGNANYAPSFSGTVTQNVQTASALGLASSFNPSTLTSNVIFTATVTNQVTASVASTAGGSVVFKDGGTPLSTNPVNSGVALYTNNTLAVGAHAITAEYSGDTIFLASTTASALAQVVRPLTSTVLASSPNPSQAGYNVVFSATVQTNAATAGDTTGRMVFTVDGTALFTNTVTGGVALYTNYTLAVGRHLVSAAYGGDGSYGASTSTNVTQIVEGIVADWTFNNAGATNTPAGFPGGATTGTAAYPRTEGAQWSDGTPFEDVSGYRHHGFYSGGANSGYVTYLTPSGTAGHKFSATGAGLFMRRARSDANTGQKANFNYGTASTPDLPYMAPGLSWTLEELVNFDNVGADATPVSSQTAFGEVESFTGNNVRCLINAQNDDSNPANTGIYLWLAPTNGVPTISAVFNTTAVNDANWHHLAVVFDRTSQTASVYLDQNPLTSINGLAGTGLLDISAVAAQNIGQNNANGCFAGINGGAVDRIAISAGVLTPSTFVVSSNQPCTLALISSPNPSVMGGNVVFTATVKTNGSTAVNATGTVVFKEGGTALSTNTVIGGVADYTNNTLAIASHTLTAVYGGDANYDRNSASVVQVVDIYKAATVTELAASLNPSPVGSNVVFTATVKTNGAVAIGATGTVIFTIDSVAMVTNSVTGGVAAPYTNSTLAVGGHLVTATYSGDGSHHPSTSTTLSQFVQGIVADWTFNHAGGTNTPAGLPGGATAGTTAYPLAEGTQFSNGTPVEDTSGERHHGFYSGGASSGYATYLTPSGTAGLRFHPTSGNGLIVRLGRTDRDAGMRANFNYGTSATPNLPYMTPGLNWTIEELVNFDNVSVDASQSQRLFGENEAFTGNNVKYVCYAQNAAGDPANTGIRVELIPNDLSTNTIDAVFNTTAVNDTGWHHLAVLFNRSNQTVSVYLDKVPLTSINGVAGTGLLDISAHAALNIGQATANGLEIGGFLGGAIDRIAISAELLTPSTFVIIPNTFTTVAVGTSANPIDEGGTVTFTATVKTNGITAANAGGTMIFKDGGTALSTNAVSSGVASCGSLGLSAGSHLITATYSGDASYGPNLSQVLTQGVRFATASLITLGSANPLPSNGTGGDPFFNFEVWTNGVLAGDAGGFVTFKEGATVVASGIPVTGGQAFYSTPALLTPGWHYVTAEYSGGSLYQASTSSLPAAQAVYNSATQVATTMALASSANPATNGDSILLTATVSTNYVDPAAAAAGTVIFKDGPVTLGSRPVSSGVASLPTGPLFAGVHKLTAEYSGDGVYGPTPASLAQTVQARTTLALSSSANPSAVGANVTFTATVQTNGVATATASGAMDFYDGANYVNSAAVLKGVATYTTAMTFGTHWMTAQYNPTTDPIHLASTSQVLTQAVKLATSTLLVSSLNPSTNGNRLTFTATVRTNGVTAADATGTMVFKNGVSLLGSPGVTNGVASFDTSVLPVGTNNLTAEYSGDVTYLASTNAPVLAQVVKSSMPTTGTNLLWSVNGGNLTISWPGYLGWILQQQTNGLNPGLTANWVDMTGTESVTTTNVPLSVVPAAFYRLRHP